MQKEFSLNDLRWDPLRKPLLPALREKNLSKVGVIDVGSNTVRMVVFDGAARSPAYFYNEKIVCALGSGLSQSGKLSPGGKSRALTAIKRFKYLAKGMGIPKLTAIATAAIREAEDGMQFCQEVYEATRQKILIIDGLQEARLSAQGVLLGWPKSFGLVCDLGGSSMELAEINKGKVGKCVTSPLGSLRLKELDYTKKERRKYIKKIVKKMASVMGPQQNRLFLVGGSWRALAKLDMVRTNYPLHVVHEYRMNESTVKKTLNFLLKPHADQIWKRARLSEDRFSLLPYAGELLEIILEIFRPKDIAISSYGIREGMLFEQMPEKLKKKDPLIEASKFSEKTSARVPSFGNNLFKFVRPLFPETGSDKLRVMRAACHLHDVSWRAHPDYRAEVCFHNATRANLGGLKHSERVFLGLSLMYRYTNKDIDDRFKNLFSLLSKNDILEAKILGKAMRLGAILWVSKNQKRAVLKWEPKLPKITLILPSSAEALYGEAAQERLESIGDTLSANTEFLISDF